MNNPKISQPAWILRLALLIPILFLSACSRVSESPSGNVSESENLTASSSTDQSSNMQPSDTKAEDSKATPKTDKPYINLLLPEAKRIEEEYGVPLDTTIAIAIQETGWGESEIGQNNHFGLRCASDDCITLNGIQYETCPDEAECFNMFAKSIKKLSDGDPSDLRVIYRNGYATSPRWAGKVRRIRRQVRKTLKKAGLQTAG